jgi:hypothetical protein
VWLPCPNYSTRGNGTVALVVVHTTEGASSYQNLSAFFNGTAGTPGAVSSHVGIDDTPDTIGEYVQRGYKAWTQGNANPVAVAAELCGFAAWTATDWAGHPAMLSNCAEWIAEECAAFGIPIQKLTPAQAQGGWLGVCGHGDLGAWGGGHSDPGSSFPWDQVLTMASGGTVPDVDPDTDADLIGEENMILTDPKSGGYWVCDPTSQPPGAVFSYQGAPYLGATNNPQMNAQSWPVVGIDVRPDTKGGGYRIVLDAGQAGIDDNGDRHRAYDFPADGSGKVRT